MRRVIEQDLDEKIGRLFEDIDEEPFALASLGQVHKARTSDGELVAVKVQHPGVAEAAEADLRNLGLVRPVLTRLAPDLDATAMLDEIRDRITDELDYETEVQHQRRLQRLLRGHPHLRVPEAHTDLSARRVLVTEYVEGLSADAIKGLGEPERDRVAEIAFRGYFGLALRAGAVVGDPRLDNCILCPDGRLCLLDFGLRARRRCRRPATASSPSCGRSPTATRRASTSAWRASGICPTRERLIATSCSST